MVSAVYAMRRGWQKQKFVSKVMCSVLRERSLSKPALFLLVIHRFMSPGDMRTEEGKERLDACVFKLPVDGKLVSMCEMNATGIREKIDAMLVAAVDIHAPQV